MSAPAPKPPESNLNEAVNMLGLRLWIACALVIVGFGVANYLLNWMIGSH